MASELEVLFSPRCCVAAILAHGPGLEDDPSTSLWPGDALHKIAAAIGGGTPPLSNRVIPTPLIERSGANPNGILNPDLIIWWYVHVHGIERAQLLLANQAPWLRPLNRGPAAVLAIGTAVPANCFRITKSDHFTELKAKMKRMCI
ncbi:hypothetical protein HU200_038337 [Digitaria exilis]|uniref:Chalcone/stilbene synthase N-terminal domain-containing protein n=1 Tax=Digitaria exilis TaxID=1010633 RepID=A0A835BCE3_9POAL|nr:hypothetical protein HU200_038337 [Digitaria exilis]